MMKIVFYTDDAGEWRWRIVAANGKIVADSGEGYANRGDAENGLAVVKEAVNNPNTLLLEEDK